MATAEAMVAPLAVTENVPKAAQTPSEAEMFQGKLYGCVTGAMTASLIGVGDKLGLYQALKKGKTSSADLAASCGINARFCEEWCRQQVRRCSVQVFQPVSYAAHASVYNRAWAARATSTRRFQSFMSFEISLAAFRVVLPH